MTKWAYCAITWTAGLVSEEQRQDLEEAGFQGRIQEAEGGAAVAQMGTVEYLGQDDQEQIVDLGATLARLGGEGWELVTIKTMPNGAQQFWLKRATE